MARTPARPVRIRKKRQRAPIGAPPEVLVPAPSATPTTLYLTTYDEHQASLRSTIYPEELQKVTADKGVTWIDIEGLADVEALRAVGERFTIHPLILSDVVHTPQPPKAESYGEVIFAVLSFAHNGDLSSDALEQVSLLMRPNLVLTFQTDPTRDALGKVRDRIQHGAARLRQNGADYLAYVIFDVIVDSHFEALDKIAAHLVELEQKVIADPGPTRMTEIQHIRHELLERRRILRRQRLAVQTFWLFEGELVAAATRDYLRDVLDHAQQQCEHMDELVEVAVSLRDLNLALLSHQMNEVMRALTLVATIFLPLSFLAGVYGMNFSTDASPYNMPELKWKYGYELWWLMAFSIAGTMIAWFRSRRWL